MTENFTIPAYELLAWRSCLERRRLHTSGVIREVRPDVLGRNTRDDGRGPRPASMDA